MKFRYMLRFATLTIICYFFALQAFGQNYAHFCDVKAGMHNRDLEKSGVIAANKKAGQMGCREVFKTAVIVSSDWDQFYDDAGNLEGRKIHMELYGETWEGQCGISHFTFKQKYLGHHDYGNLRCDFMGDFYDMDCESGYDRAPNYYGEW
jgi:hypothetical protein